MKDKKDYLFEDLPEFKVIEEIRKDVIENPQKYSSCDVRIRMGKFYTDEECQNIIVELYEDKKMLAMKLITKLDTLVVNNIARNIARKIVATFPNLNFNEIK